LGLVRYRRAYYHCDHCHRGYFPWDVHAGLTHDRLTPAADEASTLAGTVAGSFGDAAQKLLRKLSGLSLGTSTVRRVTEAAGRRVGELLDAGHTLGVPVKWRWHPDHHGRTVAYVSVDATGLGMQASRGGKAEGRMAWIGMVYNPPPRVEPPQRASQRARMAARYLAGLNTLEELGAPLRRLAAQVGMEQAEVWIALTDGGNGLEDFIRTNFGRPDVVLILDFWHAAGHLADLARALYGTDEMRVQASLAGWRHTMRHQGGAALLAALAVLEQQEGSGWSATQRESWEGETGYFRKNLKRMDYPGYEGNGWHIGSGPVESACKTVVGQRMKSGGMRWGEDGGDAVCHLRALFKSEGDGWDAFWARGIN
jgi:hypothetical protein